MNQRLRELLTSGELGDVQQVDIELSIPSPPDNDPRWSLELAGGATMDLGCYVLNAARQFGRWSGKTPSVVSAEATLKKPDIDCAMRVEFAYSNGVQGKLHWDMNAESRRHRDSRHSSRSGVRCPAPGQPDRHHSRRQHRGANSWRPDVVHL